ncbi:MAG: penicillin-binding protein 2 [Chloroflexi bacterium]|nr:penicillin-binding protein 2 [Chloroflexota bacterium]
MNPWDGKLRVIIFQAAVVLAFVAVAAKLWDLQIVSAEQYQQSADRNQYRLLPIAAPRGVLYDRTGRMLVKNVPSFTVSIVPAALPEDMDERGAMFERLSDLLDIPAYEPADEEPAEWDALSIETILRLRTINPYQPVRIATEVDRQAAFIIEEEHLSLPGVKVDVEPLREYAYGSLLGHLLGYVRAIPEHLIDVYLEDKSLGYAMDDQVGLAGIEQSMEDLLRGVKGQKHIQVDALEREVLVVAEEPATEGYSLMLTLDVDLQEKVTEALRKGMEGAKSEVGVVIIMDPRTGEVLSMVSLPGYDNNLFSGAIEPEVLEALYSDPLNPLFNHGVSGLYSPGSTFKVVPAVAALEAGAITVNTRVSCGGVMYLGNKYFPNDPKYAQPFYCWRRGGHGSLNVVGALMHSCNIFFNQIAGGFGDLQGLGMERLAEAAIAFGFGAESGIDLPGEAAGLVPSDRWKRITFGESWLTGDTYNAAIGQGFWQVTPLQLVNSVAAIANWGTLYRPQLVYQVIDHEGRVVDALQPDVIRPLPFSHGNLDLVREGMRLVGTPQGTAYLLDVPGVNVAGKTGTAEFARLDDDGNLMLDAKGNLPTHAWFTAFAPYEDPEIAMVVFLDNGGEGSRTAVPVASDILRYYFGIAEPEPTPTP